MTKKVPNMLDEDDLIDAFRAIIANKDYDCELCKHLHKNKVTCDAFPDGIPEPIISGEVAHTKPMYNQDNDIVFERA